MPSVFVNEIFNNKTLRYRINGFAYACKMENIEVPPSFVVENGEKLSRSVGVLFNTTEKKRDIDEEVHYFIATNEDHNPKCNSVTLSGQYGDLSFTFVNYYKKEKLDKKIIDLPFSISLEKKIDKDTYQFNIETVEDIRCKFKIAKYREYKSKTLYDDVVFYANVADFSKILKLVKSFVFNPVLVFNTYNEIDQNYKRIYTNHDLEKAIMQDEKLDKPVGKIKKYLIKKIGLN